MGSNESERDSEILELSHELHSLTGQIKALVTEIEKTSVLLLVRVDEAEEEGWYHDDGR